MSEELEIDELAPWLVLLITALGGWMRVFMLDRLGLWLDEAFSVWLAHHSLPGMLSWIARIDQHPPLYYLLLHSWMALQGDSPYAVRLLSVLFGAATIPLIYLIGKRLSGVTMGLAAALILAFSPFNIRYAQEARMYTLLAFNAAAALYALVRLLTDPRSALPIGSQFRQYLRLWRAPAPPEPTAAADFSALNAPRPGTGWKAWLSRHRWSPIRSVETDLAWVALVVFSAATLLTHNTAVLFLLADNLFVAALLLVQRKKKPGSLPAFQAPSPGNWVKAQLAIFLLWSPWLVVFIQQASRVYHEFWIPSPTWQGVLQVLKSFLNESILVKPDQVQLAWILYALVLGLGLVHFRKRMARFFLLLALFAVPFLGELLVSLRRPIFLDRTLIWLTIPLFLLLAAGIAQLRARILMLVVGAIFVTNNLFSTADYYRFMLKEDWDTAAGYVANFAQKDDLVLFNSNFVEIPFDLYFKSYKEQYSLQVVERGAPLDLIADGVLEPKMTEKDVPALLRLIHAHARVWLVYSHDSYTDPGGLIPRTLAAQMKLTRQRDFYGGKVQLYEAP